MPRNQEKQKNTLAYNPNTEEREIITRLRKRIFSELKPARQVVISPEDHKTIEGIWRDCDKLYPPHRYFSTALEDWQSKNSQPNPYSKVMTALSIIIANNPAVILRASTKEYEAKTNLIKALYERSWKVGLCKEQLKMFAHNLGKYGFAVGRTYPRKISRKISDITFIDPLTNKQTYEEKEVDIFNEVWFENMNIWNCWIDDIAIPGDPWSVRDWCWRKVMPLDTFKYDFRKFKNINAVLAGGNTQFDDSGYTNNVQKEYVSPDLVEMFFYENQEKDEFHILANNVLITDTKSPLPYTHKRLSLTFTQWSPRSATSIYGIGIIEALKEDQDTLDKIRNMSIDELVLSIYQMFFHGPSTNFAEGKLRVSPGRLVQVTNPNDIQPVKFSPPSTENVRWLEMIEKSMDDATGITKSLSGEFIGKTAFEVQQNREAGLRKMKIPLSNIDYALTIEARNHIDLIQQVMAVPQDVRRIVGKKTFDEYLADAQRNPEFYFQLGGETPENPPQLFRQREVRLNLEENKEQGFIESKTTNSFNITPELIRWEGEIEIQPQSTVAKSIEIEQQMTLDLFNIVGRLPTTALAKAERRLLKKFNEDPDDWMPTQEELKAKQQIEAMEMEKIQAMQGMAGNTPLETSEMESVVPRRETEVTGKSPIGQIISNSKIA